MTSAMLNLHIGIAIRVGFILLIASPALGNSIQPPTAHTGAAGELDCRACHMDGAMNPDTGRLILKGLPDRYIPGQVYMLTVTLMYPHMERAGFQLSARFPDSPSKGKQAGALVSQDDRVQVVTDQTNEIQYVQHSEAGMDLTGPAEVSWRFVWQAPDMFDAAVVFNASANGANYDDSEFGDAVFLLTRHVAGVDP